MDIKQINEALKLLDIEPLIDFSDPEKLKPEDFQALALMYANQTFRNYLFRCYNNAVKGAALRSITEVDIAFSKGQALLYKKLLIDGKNAYEHLDRIRKIKEKQNNAQNQSSKGNEGV